MHDQLTQPGITRRQFERSSERNPCFIPLSAFEQDRPGCCKHLYVICGEGRIDIVRQENPDRYSLEGMVRTAPRARTGLFVPEEGRLYVAAPAIGTSPAKLLAYRVR